jgi:hypothetical protein
MKVRFGQFLTALAVNLATLLRRIFPALCVALALGLPLSSMAEGLKVDLQRGDDKALWPTWHARIGVVAQPNAADAAAAQGPRAAAILGDYYFTSSGFEARRVVGGLRATTGWLYGGGLALDAGANTSANALTASLVRSGQLLDESRLRHAGYIGIGYTGLMVRQGLGFTADLGLVGSSLTPGGARLDRDVTLGDIRLAPTVRFGVSYAF